MRSESVLTPAIQIYRKASSAVPLQHVPTSACYPQPLIHFQGPKCTRVTPPRVLNSCASDRNIEVLGGDRSRVEKENELAEDLLVTWLIVQV